MTDSNSMRGDQSVRLAVAGATGRVGSLVSEVANSRGHHVVPIARSKGIDVVSGVGLAQALEGVDVIIDAATGPSADERDATAFFTASAGNLQKHGAAGGVGTIVAVSIIGCDRFKAGYNAAKLVHEQALSIGPIPVRVLRAAQFHEFVGQLVAWGTQGDVAHVQRMRTQLVAARTVAERLVDMALDPRTTTTGAPPELAGPRVELLADAARAYVARRSGPTRIEETSDLEDPDRELFEQGGLLPGPEAELAGPTYGEWLEAGVAAAG